MGIGQVLTMPLFFASNAIYPLAMMPRWLQPIARANPLTYVVDALRASMVGGGALGLALDFAVAGGTLAAVRWNADRAPSAWSDREHRSRVARRRHRAPRHRRNRRLLM